MALEPFHDDLAGEADSLATRWAGSRFGEASTESVPSVATELIEGVIAALDSSGTPDALRNAAGALGVIRAQQGMSATTLIEDMLSIRPLLWGFIAHRTSDQDLGSLLLAQDRIVEVLESVVCWAVDVFVEEATRVLARQATRDPITGKANRVAFDAMLEQSVRSASRDGAPSLVVVDLDRFKTVNDTHGHLRGDQALLQVAEALSRAVRDADLVARVGGDEFAVLLAATPLADALPVVERMHEMIRQEAATVPVEGFGASIGVAHALVPSSAQHLFGAADLALYRAKTAGGDAIEIATDDDLSASDNDAEAGDSGTEVDP